MDTPTPAPYNVITVVFEPGELRGYWEKGSGWDHSVLIKSNLTIHLGITPWGILLKMVRSLSDQESRSDSFGSFSLFHVDSYAVRPASRTGHNRLVHSCVSWSWARESRNPTAHPFRVPFRVWVSPAQFRTSFAGLNISTSID